MYFLTVALLMFVLPIGSILVEILVMKSPLGIFALVGKWFVFWSVGLRLFLTGLRQTLQPRFTAETILGIKATESLQVVQELGFANISIGTLGIISMFSSNWVMPAAVAGCLFYGSAGIRHLVRRDRNKLENIAVVSDLFVCAVLLAFVIAEIMPR